MSDILTPRLILRLVPLAGLAATAARDIEACRRLISPGLGEEWLQDSWVADLRLTQWKEDPAYAPWSIRAIARRDSAEVVGYINCHDRPQPMGHGGAIHLAIELGYEIFPAFRRRGYASEAIEGLALFAAEQGVTRVRLSIAPGNAPSLALARKLGATYLESHIDERDGPEDVHVFAVGPRL